MQRKLSRPSGTPARKHLFKASVGVCAILILLFFAAASCTFVENPGMIVSGSDAALDWGKDPPGAADRAGHIFDTKRPFEWWYIDGHLDTGETFVGVFFDPSFTTGTPVVTFSLYDRNWKKTFYSREFKKGELRSSTDDAAIESPAGHLRRIDDKTYRVLWNMDDLRADFTLTTTAPGWRPRHDGGHGEENLEFFWAVHQARNRIEGTLTRNGETTAVSGTGYFDHNWGIRPLHEITNRWVWGRILVDDYTIIYADVRYLDPAVKGRPLYVARGGEIILGAGNPTITQEDFVLHPRLKRHYPRRIAIYHSDGDTEVALTITLRNLAEEVDLLEDSGMNSFSQWITRTFVARPSYFRVSADFEGFVRRGNVKDRLSGECLYEVMIFE